MTKQAIEQGFCQCGCGEKTTVHRGKARLFLRGHKSRTRFLPFTEAGNFVRSLRLKSHDEWSAYCLSGRRPANIPSNPSRVYKAEWTGYRDFLGTKRRAFRPFIEAREFSRSLGLKSHTQWRAYAKSAAKPNDIPANPSVSYHEWTSWVDWLGNGYSRGSFRPFSGAREFVHVLNLRSRDEWTEYYRSGKKPHDIPARPGQHYRSQWLSWGDWLGTGKIANQRRKFLLFTEAREFVRTLGLKSPEEWSTYAASGKRPSNIPSNPSRVYSGDWGGLADWLGYAGLGGNKWTTNAIGAFLESIAPEIPMMRDASLVALITEAGLDLPLRQLLGRVPMARVIADLRNGGDEIQVRLRNGGEIVIDPEWNPRNIEDEGFAHDEVGVDEDNVHVADRLKGKVSREFIERLVQEKLSGLLVKYLNGDPDVADIVKQQGGEFYQQIRTRFESEIRGIMEIETSSWKLRDKRTGKPTQPNLMQRYIAYKIQHNRTWCNWSGTGAGKTGSAGLASYVIGSRLTVVLCPNSTVSQWEEELVLTFQQDSCRVVTDASDAKRGEGSFLVLNYEKFQSDKSSAALVQTIVALRPDLVVLDEVQLVKRREQGGSSIRREKLEGMLRQLPKTRVLGMTATPVINELREGVSLLEVVTGKPQSLKTGRSVLNALNLHFALLQHGLRYKPEYQRSLLIKPEPFVNNAVLLSLRQIAEKGRADVLPIERAILPAKLEHVRSRIKPGTLIYLEFVKGMVPIVRTFVESMGLTVGEYVGNTPTKERDALKRRFIAGELDVLIGSQAIALGVDGLQKRCNRLIVLSLPWTHAAFQQLYGRLYRQGSDFAEVEVLIPQLVTLQNGQRWSWDEARYSVIEQKKTLSDTATDGYVPTSEHLSRTEFAKRAMDALEVMIGRTQRETDSRIAAPTTGAPASAIQEGGLANL